MTDRFRKGDTRHDGYRFKQYKKKPDGSLAEEWLSEEAFQRAKNWYKTEKAKQSQKRWASRNREKTREYSLNYQSRNKETTRRRSRNYAKNNPEKRRSFEAKRRERIYNSYQYLSSDDKKIIFCFYEISTRVTNCLGIQHHVDHIIPLSKKGKHIPSNLQILPASINLRKKDKVVFCYDGKI